VSSAGPSAVREILALQAGAHLCLIYDDDPLEQLAALLPYLRQGLENGERCIYVADDLTVHDLQSALQAYGIDEAGEVERGALFLWTRKEWRPDGGLDSLEKADELRNTVHAALAAGFTGVRFAIEMTWTLDPDVDVERLRHWEATINSLLTADPPVRMICQYSCSRLSLSVLEAALATHPLAILGHEVCPNLYYEAPLLLDGATEYPAADASRLDWMLSRLRWARTFEAEREQRIRAEAALYEAEISRQKAEELHRIAEESSAKLRQANAVKDEFLGLVSHELRTPITIIQGNSHVLLKVLTLSGEYHAALDDIRTEAERLNRLVNNLLVLAKLESGQDLEVEPILIVPILERVLSEHRRKHETHQINLRHLVTGQPNMGNEVYVEQILVNLISNAEKYSPPGSEIEVVLSTEERWRVVRVLDRGIGLDGANPEDLFDAFYRSDTASQISAGLGVGLAVCKRLVEAQGGQIWAKPREGGGSEFGFTLPLCEDPND
jgi:signal transduction histidine kinase